MKGKCYSMVDRGQRRAQDQYETPKCLITTFIDAFFRNEVDNSNSVFSPACGNHIIDNTLIEYGYESVYASDIEEDGDDFLKSKDAFDWIIENPPYSLAFEFIQKAKQLAEKGFAFLLPLSYLQGQRRYDEVWMDNDYPLHSIYVFNRFPLMGEASRPDGKIKTGMMALAWFVWKKEGYGHIPEIHWLDIRDFIIRKADK